MPVSVKQSVRYWSFLAAKFLASGGVLASLVWSVNRLWAAPSHPDPKLPHVLGYDKYLVYLICIALVYFVGIALFYLSILDQRYRCRVCLRRLRMPIETGSWSKMLQLGRPKIQYICLYGHGKLNIPELHLTGMDIPEWTEHADYWAELCGSGQPGDGRE